MQKRKKYLTLLLSGFIALGLTSCSDDNDDMPGMELSGSVMVDDQALEGNMLTISNVDISEDGWVVIHRNNENGEPMVPEIISVPKMVQAGSATDVTIELKGGVEIEDGETLWVMLHNDSGEMGTYEFDGSNGLDLPIMDEMGGIVTKSFTVNVTEEAQPTGSLMVEDQMLMDNKISVSSITMDQSGFVVVHADNGDGGPVVPAIISELLYLEAGTHEDVEITFTDDADVTAGDTVWVMLHTDTGEEMVYEFDGENGLDLPITNEDENPVMMSLNITESEATNTAAVSADSQTLTNSTLKVASVTLEESGWVVVHADNGENAPVVPEIISEPVFLEAGTHKDVEVPFKDDANLEMGDKVWIMLHYDTGEAIVYEFDGENGLDLPITDAEEQIVMTSIEITATEEVAVTGTLDVIDQVLSDNMISIGSIELENDGWVVVHADNGEGGPVVPEIISVPMYLEAGTHEDVMVEFKESADVNVGDTVWVMLHNDTGAKAVYEFDGMNGLDLPITENGNVVVTPIVITE